MANDGQTPLRYPPEEQMSSFEGSHEAKVVVAQNVEMKRRLLRQLSGDQPIESNSD
jgi:hypothetical protein